MVLKKNRQLLDSVTKTTNSLKTRSLHAHFLDLTRLSLGLL